MSQKSPFYSVYLSPHAVEIRHIDDGGNHYAQLVCSQANYHNALTFAVRLAFNKNLPLKNLAGGDRASARTEVAPEGGDGFWL